MIPKEAFQKIQEELTALEKTKQIKILFACESGSRGWGFASQDSDFDVRFIYRHDKDWYLSIGDRKDIIEQPINDMLDIGGWDIRKYLRLLGKSNAVTFEWLQSPVIYKNMDSFQNKAFALSKNYFEPKPCIHHYLGLAGNSYAGFKNENETKAKKYFYVIRPILAAYWIALKNEIPPMEYGKLITLIKEESILKLLDMLLIAKQRSNETDLIDTIPELHEYIENIIEICNKKASALDVGNHDSDALNVCFRKVLGS